MLATKMYFDLKGIVSLAFHSKGDVGSRLPSPMLVDRPRQSRGVSPMLRCYSGCATFEAWAKARSCAMSKDPLAVSACVFDAYGTIFDFASAAARCSDV